MKEKISISWSGGKDSAYALYQLKNSGKYDIVNLHTVFDADLKRVGLHGVPEHLIEAQAEAMGFPLEKLYLQKDDSHDSYEQIIKDFCLKQKAEGITHIMYGDIFLEDLKVYREKQLSAVGIEGVFPIWQKGTAYLVGDFIDEGFKTVVCAANAELIDKNQIGKILDHQWLANLPTNVDPCGENGEFHTFVYDGPLFNHPINFKIGEVVKKTYTFKMREEDGSVKDMQSAFWFQELL